MAMRWWTGGVQHAGLGFAAGLRVQLRRRASLTARPCKHSLSPARTRSLENSQLCPYQVSSSMGHANNVFKVLVNGHMEDVVLSACFWPPAQARLPTPTASMRPGAPSPSTQSSRRISTTSFPVSRASFLDVFLDRLDASHVQSKINAVEQFRRCKRSAKLSGPSVSVAARPSAHRDRHADERSCHLAIFSPHELTMAITACAMLETYSLAEPSQMISSVAFIIISSLCPNLNASPRASSSVTVYRPQAADTQTCLRKLSIIRRLFHTPCRVQDASPTWQV
jgi:hypothetical protein